MRLLLLLSLLAAAAPRAQPGAFDLGFGSDGTVGLDGLTFYGGGVASDVAAGPDGSLFVVAHQYGSAGGARVLRLLPSGVVDVAFSNTAPGYGVFVGPERSSHAAGGALATLTDGRVVVVGTDRQASGGSAVPFAERLGPDGRRDETFGTDGFADIDPTVTGFGAAVRLDGDRTVVGLSSEDGRCGVAVLTGAGRPDTLFGPRGIRWIESGALACTTRALAVLPGGLVLAADLQDGVSGAFTVGAFGLRRDGAVWTAFGNGGTVRVGSPSTASHRPRLAVRADSVLLSGAEACRGQVCAVVRALTPTGQPDVTFGTGGTVTDSTLRWSAFDIAADGEGRVLIAGSATRGFDRVVSAVRRTQRGAIDPSFGTAGVASVLSPRVPYGPTGGDLVLDPQGRAVVLTTRNRGTTAYEFPTLVRYLGGNAVATEPPPGHVAVLAVTPNPVARVARVSLMLAEAATASVRVVDALGRTVAVLADGPLAAGAHVFALDASGLPAGVYAVVATVGGTQRATRVTVVR